MQSTDNKVSGEAPSLEGMAYCGGVSCEQSVVEAVSLLAGRWAVPVLEKVCFSGGRVRFNALQRELGTVSAKELSRQLATFVRHAILRRCEGERAGVRVEYELTRAGRELLQHMQALGHWARERDALPALLSAQGRASDWRSPLQGLIDKAVG